MSGIVVFALSLLGVLGGIFMSRVLLIIVSLAYSSINYYHLPFLPSLTLPLSPSPSLSCPCSVFPCFLPSFPSPFLFSFPLPPSFSLSLQCVVHFISFVPFLSSSVFFAHVIFLLFSMPSYLESSCSFNLLVQFWHLPSQTAL